MIAILNNMPADAMFALAGAIVSGILLAAILIWLVSRFG